MTRVALESRYMADSSAQTDSPEPADPQNIADAIRGLGKEVEAYIDSLTSRLLKNKVSTRFPLPRLSK